MKRSRTRVCFFAVLSFAVFFSIQCAAQYDQPTEAALERARQANSAGKFTDAVKAFKEANKLQGNACSACYRGMALAYTSLGDMGNADDSSKKAVSAARDTEERAMAHTRRGIVLMAFAGSNAKRLTAAEAEFRQALSDAPSEPQIRFELGLSLLKQKKDDEGIKELKAVVAADFAGDLARRARSLIGNPRRAREWVAPQFEASTLQGDQVSLAALAGKVVVLDFWATWCAPCRASVPELKDLLKKYPREKLALISVSADEDEQAWKDFVAKKNMDWPQVFDAKYHIAERFNVHAFPTYLIIDREGVVQQKIEGLDPRQTVASRIKDVLKNMKELN